jgi:hypothetical protein
LSSRPFEDKSRPVVLLAVLLLHGAIVIVLTREAQQNFGSIVDTAPLIIHFLSRTAPRHDTVASPVRRVEARLAAKAQPASPTAGANDHDEALSVTTPSVTTPTAPLIVDWATEAEIATRNSLAKAETERHYRNLAGLSAIQLEWTKKMHLIPMNRESPFEAKHDTRCVFIGPVFFCDMRIGKRKSRADLFKDMREYLDERLTDPLP